jgi:hypothetical protein
MSFPGRDPVKTQLLERACHQLLELGYGFRLVGEQVQLRFPVPCHPNGAVVDPVIDPRRRDPGCLGDLRHRQVAEDAPRMGLAAFAEQPMPETQEANRARQDGRVLGRAMPLPR